MDEGIRDFSQLKEPSLGALDYKSRLVNPPKALERDGFREREREQILGCEGVWNERGWARGTIPFLR